MKFPKPIHVKDIVGKIQAEIIGNKNLMVSGINEIHQVGEGDITFVDIEKYFEKSLKSSASVIILNKRSECPNGKALLLCDNPFEAYNSLVLEFRPVQPMLTTISDTASLDPSSAIEPNVIIGHHVKIGKNCYLQANVYIAEHTIIGDNVHIQAGAVIGTDAFYFKRDMDGFRRFRSAGRVIIQDNVDIGAACTINKGVSGDTIIGEGSKLDCQVQVGHDVHIGKRCLIAAQVGISGNTRIGDETVIYGQAGIAQNLTIGERVIVSAKAGVSKDLESGKLYFGIPAAEARSKYRELAALRRLPDFFAAYDK